MATVDIGGDCYFLKDDQPDMKLGCKSRAVFLKTFPESVYGPIAEIERLFRTYLAFADPKLDAIDAEDKPALIAVLEKRASLLRESNEYNASRLDSVQLDRYVIGIQQILQQLRGVAATSTKRCVSKKYTDDEIFMIVMELAWKLAHPEAVGKDKECEWQSMLEEMDKLELGKMVAAIQAAPRPAGAKPLNMLRTPTVPRIREALKIENAMEAVADIRPQFEALLQLLVAKKYLGDAVVNAFDTERMKELEGSLAESVTKVDAETSTSVETASVRTQTTIEQTGNYASAHQTTIPTQSQSTMQKRVHTAVGSNEPMISDVPMNSGVSVEERVVPAEEPKEVEEPVVSAEEPKAPATPAEEPKEPATPAEEPKEPVEKPKEPVEKPNEPATPAEANEPAVAVEEPKEAEEPVVSAEANEPATPAEEPTNAAVSDELTGPAKKVRFTNQPVPVVVTEEEYEAAQKELATQKKIYDTAKKALNKRVTRSTEASKTTHEANAKQAQERMDHAQNIINAYESAHSQSGGSLSTNTLYPLMTPIFDYLRDMYDPVYEVVEKFGGSIRVGQLVPLLHACQRIKTYRAQPYGIYRLVGLDKEVVAFITAQLGSTKEHLARIQSQEGAVDEWLSDLFRLPQVSLATIKTPIAKSTDRPAVHLGRMGVNFDKEANNKETKSKEATFFNKDDLYLFCTNSIASLAMKNTDTATTQLPMVLLDVDATRLVGRPTPIIKTVHRSKEYVELTFERGVLFTDAELYLRIMSLVEDTYAGVKVAVANANANADADADAEADAEADADADAETDADENTSQPSEE